MSFLYPNEPVNEALITAARQNPHQVAAVKLSKTQLRVLGSIRDKERVTSEQIAKRCGLSNSWASTLLKQLSVRLHLDRQSGSRQSGGVEYVYVKSR
ncbi:winged helix-turn-helix transcriptional regulator [Vibrio sp. TRT 17S01]|uniref:winged helix-turn-helix transcriptional regulator n=1 Tax=Vibrio sp. TRT 17S01 TaxID=3418505 RepID=UPI003CED5696